nr:MAG TPA: hypothetical protein [Caudoviricetes sp.]
MPNGQVKNPITDSVEKAISPPMSNPKPPVPKK